MVLDVVAFAQTHRNLPDNAMRRPKPILPRGGLQKVEGSDERREEEQSQRDREPSLKLGDIVTRSYGGPRYMVVDFIDTFESPGIEQDDNGKWQPLPPEASVLITVARRCPERGVIEHDLDRVLLARFAVCG